MEKLVIAGREFDSRLFLGTGKFNSNEVMEQAIKYIDEFLEKEGTTFQDKIDYEKVKSFDDGLMKGEKAGIMKTAKKMLKDGLNINSIAKYTGLSKEEIENLN